MSFSIDSPHHSATTPVEGLEPFAVLAVSSSRPAAPLPPATGAAALTPDALNGLSTPTIAPTSMNTSSPHTGTPPAEGKAATDEAQRGISRLRGSSRSRSERRTSFFAEVPTTTVVEAEESKGKGPGVVGNPSLGQQQQDAPRHQLRMSRPRSVVIQSGDKAHEGGEEGGGVVRESVSRLPSSNFTTEDGPLPSNPHPAGTNSGGAKQPRSGNRKPAGHRRGASAPFSTPPHPSAGDWGFKTFPSDTSLVPLPNYTSRQRRSKSSSSLHDSDAVAGDGKRHSNTRRTSRTSPVPASDSLELEVKEALKEVDHLLTCVEDSPFVSVQVNRHTVRPPLGRPPLYGSTIKVMDKDEEKMVYRTTSRAIQSITPSGSASSSYSEESYFYSDDDDTTVTKSTPQKKNKCEKAPQDSDSDQKKVFQHSGRVTHKQRKHKPHEHHPTDQTSTLPPHPKAVAPQTGTVSVVTAASGHSKILPGSFLQSFSRRCVHHVQDIAPPPHASYCGGTRSDRGGGPLECSGLLSSMISITPEIVDESPTKTRTTAQARRQLPRCHSAAEGGGTGSASTGNTTPVDGPLQGTLHLFIRGMSPLPADATIVHPFVRVWVVDCQTGVNLLGDAHHNMCGITQPFDLRMRATRSPWWETELCLPLPSLTDSVDALGCTKRAVLLLEVCDAGNESIYGTYLPRCGLQHICWGYYMLYDAEGRLQLPRDNVHIQLYPFPREAPWLVRLTQQLLPDCFASPAVYAPSIPKLDVGGALIPRSTARDESTEESDAAKYAYLQAPEVFRVFHNPNNRKVPFRGGLVMSARVLSDNEMMDSGTQCGVLAPMLAYEEYLLNLLLAAGLGAISPLSRWEDEALNASAEPEGSGRGYDPQTHGGMGGLGGGSLAAMLNFRREAGERPLLPTKLLGTYLVEGKVTCLSLSTSGFLLAVGVTVNMRYEVQLRDPLAHNFSCVAKLVGHTGHIHAVAFNRKDSLLISCSADMTARIWKPVKNREQFSAGFEEEDDDRGLLAFAQTRCVLILPHSFPVYDAVFHQGHVVTCGCSPFLLAWKCDSVLHSHINSSSSDEEDVVEEEEEEEEEESVLTASQLTASFSPGEAEPKRRPPKKNQKSSVAVSQIVSKLSNESAAVLLSLSSSEKGNHVWSVSSSGKVTCWRAVNERKEKGKKDRIWQMSARRSLTCSGGTKIAVGGKYVLVTCAKLPITYLIDYATGQQHFAVPTRLAPGSPLCLLPDGDAFVAGTGDGSLLAWECMDGGQCTPAGGYPKLRLPHGIHTITWAVDRHLCAFGSVAPLSPESALLRQEETTAGLQPIERTAISVAGTVRSPAAVVLSNGVTAAQEFTHACGSELSSKRRTQVAVAKTKERTRTRTMDKDRDRRLYDHKDTIHEVSEQFSLKQEERLNRMDFILNFWRGLTQQHRHGDAAAPPHDEEGEAETPQQGPKPSSSSKGSAEIRSSAASATGSGGLLQDVDRSKNLFLSQTASRSALENYLMAGED